MEHIIRRRGFTTSGIKKKKTQGKQPKGLSEFRKEVKLLQGAGYSYKDAKKTIRGAPKWVKKRWERVSQKRKARAEETIRTTPEGAIETIKSRFMEKRGLTTELEFMERWERGKS